MEDTVKENNTHNYITTDSENRFGYDRLEQLSLNKKCYKLVKEKMVQQSKIDGVEIKTSIEKNTLPPRTKIFHGEMKIDKNFKHLCAETKNINIFHKDEKLEGFFTFTRRSGESGISKIYGNSKKFTSKDVTFSIETINNKEILGSFESTNCNGHFKTKLVKTVQ